MSFKIDRVDVTSVEGLIGGSFRSGAVERYAIGTAGGLIVHAKMHGRCENPIEVYRAGGFVPPSGEGSETRIVNGADRRAIAVTLRCRHCRQCLFARAQRWRKAATAEMMRASLHGLRTWFGTLTLSAEQQAEAGYRAMARYGVQSFSELSPEEQLPLRHAAVS